MILIFMIMIVIKLNNNVADSDHNSFCLGPAPAKLESLGPAEVQNSQIESWRNDRTVEPLFGILQLPAAVEVVAWLSGWRSPKLQIADYWGLKFSTGLFCGLNHIAELKSHTKYAISVGLCDFSTHLVFLHGELCNFSVLMTFQSRYWNYIKPLQCILNLQYCSHWTSLSHQFVVSVSFKRTAALTEEIADTASS